MTATVLNISENAKVCSKCAQAKALVEFHCNAGRNKIGITDNCKDCRNEMRRKIWAARKVVRIATYKAPLTKICSRCKIEKSTTEFVKNKDRIIGVTPDCRACRNARYKDPRKGDIKSRPDRLKRHYGITYEDVVQTLINQFGRCANRACGEEISLNVPLGKGRAVIDHDHKTGKFRALLCPGCNSLLGSVETKQNLMLGLQEYLTKFK